MSTIKQCGGVGKVAHHDDVVEVVLVFGHQHDDVCLTRPGAKRGPFVA